MTEKKAKLLIIENSWGLVCYIITEEKVQLKAENFKEKNLKKDYRINCYPPLEGLYVKTKNLYKPYSANWYERTLVADHKHVPKYKYHGHGYHLMGRVITDYNRILFRCNRAPLEQLQKYFAELPQLQLYSFRLYQRIIRGLGDDLNNPADKFRAAQWLRLLQQQYGPLVEGLGAPYLRHFSLEAALNLQGALFLAQLKPLEKAVNPLAGLLPFIYPQDYSFHEYTNLLGYLKLFEAALAAGKGKEFLGLLKEQAGDKYWQHRYEAQNGWEGILNSPIKVLGSLYRLLGFILHNIARQKYKKRFDLLLKTYVEGACWTTGLELEKLRVSNFAGVVVKNNSGNSRLQLEQLAVILGLTKPFGFLQFYASYKSRHRR